jgi:hypothetical protein
MDKKPADLIKPVVFVDEDFAFREFTDAPDYRA